jgi:RNA-binding protein 39
VGFASGTITHASHLLLFRVSQGYVFLKFDSIESAQKVAAALNGRWFAKKQITVEFLPEPAYNARFSNAS